MLITTPKASINSSNFLIYTASAGSGKTFTLAKNYLKIVLTHPQDDAYKTILAITFTNKAVEEMKERILNYLEDFAQKTTSDAGLDMLTIIQEETKINTAQLKQKAKRVLKNLLHQYGSFEVSTIDKFTHRIIRTFSKELNLSNNFQVSLDFSDLLTQAIDNLLNKAGDDAELTKQFVDFSMSKIEDQKSWDIKFDLNAFAKNLNKEQFIPYIKEIESINQDSFKTIEQHLWQQKNAIQLQAQSRVTDLLNFLEKINLTAHFSRNSFTNHLQKIKEFSELGLEKYQNLDDIKVNKSGITIFEEHKNKIFEYYCKLKELTKKLSIVNEILKQWPKLSLLTSINQSVKELQSEQNILPIKEFNQLVYEQIQGQPAPFIYEKLGERYKHFFIDEFQDTSKMQWQNLIPLISNALDSEDNQGIRGTLMIVGDPKQAIYRFRGSNVEQMLEIINHKNPFRNHEKIIQNLKYNFRSFKEVVDFNNQFFFWIANQFNNNTYQELYQKAQQNFIKIQQGQVKIEFVEDIDELKKDELHLQKVLNYINHVIDLGYQYQDIVVLTRNNNNSKQIAKILVEHQIPIMSSDSLMLENSDLVKLIVNFIKYTHQPFNQNAKTELLIYFANQQSEIPVYDFVTIGLKKETQEDFNLFLNHHQITLNLAEITWQSLYQQVSYFVHQTLRITEPDAYVLHFMQMVFDQNVLQLKSATEFINYWETIGKEESIEVPSGQNAVHLMTFHKSKGLEFPVVIIPFLNYKFTQPEDVWYNTANLTQEISHVMMTDKKLFSLLGEPFLATHNQVKEANYLDNINLLYVAFTRAKEQLYIVSDFKLTTQGTPTLDNISYFLVEYLKFKKLFNQEQLLYEFGEEVQKTKQETIETVNYLPAHKIKDWTHKIKVATLESQLWITQKAEKREYGNLIHSLLSQIYTINDLETVLNKALIKGWFAVELLNEIKQILTAVINHPLLINHFDLKQTTWNERKIITPDAQYIPDKVSFIDQKTCVVIDYKTGVPENHHAKQINQYSEILKLMNLNVQKKFLVYITDEVNVVTL